MSDSQFILSFLSRQVNPALVLVLAFLLLMISPGLAAASLCERDAAHCDAPVTVIIDEEKLDASPPAFIEGGRVLVPLRALSEALGASVTWNNAARTATVVSDSQPAPLYTEALEAAVRQLAPYMDRCTVRMAHGEQQSVLCLDPDKHRIEMSPAVFRQVKWYMDVANVVAQAPDFQPGRTYDAAGAIRLLQNAALPLWDPTPGLQPSTPATPSPPLVAVLAISSGSAVARTYELPARSRQVQVEEGHYRSLWHNWGEPYRETELEGELIQLENWQLTEKAWGALVR